MRHAQLRMKWSWNEFIPENEKSPKTSFPCCGPKGGGNNHRHAADWRKPPLRCQKNQIVSPEMNRNVSSTIPLRNSPNSSYKSLKVCRNQCHGISPILIVQWWASARRKDLFGLFFWLQTPGCCGQKLLSYDWKREATRTLNWTMRNTWLSPWMTGIAPRHLGKQRYLTPSLNWGHIPVLKTCGNILTLPDTENTWWLDSEVYNPP